MRVAPSKLSCLLLPGPFAAQLEVKGAQLEGGGSRKEPASVCVETIQHFLQTSAKQQQCHWWEDRVIWGMLDSAP